MKNAASTVNTQVIRAPRKKVFAAFSDPRALEQWQAPDTMTAKVHSFDFKTGGGYEMSLYYPENNSVNEGKTNAKEDRFKAQFVEIIPDEKIVQLIVFKADDPAFAGEVTMETIFEETHDGTKVTMNFYNLPTGIKPEDNETGTASSLKKLAKYAEDK